MKAPERLFSSDPDLVRLREVLEQDEPPRGASERATERVLASTIASGAPHARPRLSTKSWLVAGVGAPVLVTGALVWRQAPEANPPSPTAAAPAPAARRHSTVTPDEATSSTANALPAEPSIRVDDLPTAPRAVTPPSPAGTTDPLVEELALVERARTALARGRGRECLDATKTYETRFAKSGLFREEVEVMHIEALAMSGERGAARARGLRFLAVYTDTPYVERVRRVLGEAAE